MAALSTKERLELADEGAQQLNKQLRLLRDLVADKPAHKATDADVRFLLAIARAEHATGPGHSGFKAARRVGVKRRHAARRLPDVFSLEA